MSSSTLIVLTVCEHVCTCDEDDVVCKFVLLHVHFCMCVCVSVCACSWSYVPKLAHMRQAQLHILVFPSADLCLLLVLLGYFIRVCRATVAELRLSILKQTRAKEPTKIHEGLGP